MSLELRDLWKSYGAEAVLRGLNLRAEKGTLLVILGPSGCGKTTILHIIAGILKQDRGDVIIDDHIMNDVPPEERPVGLVFQDYLLFPHLSVFENIAFGLKNRKLSKEDIRNRVDYILNLLKIKELRNRYPSSLSGGESRGLHLQEL